MSEKNTEKLIIGLFEGRISVEGLTELKKEFQNNSNSRKLFNEYLNIWQSTAKAGKTNDYDPDTAWQQFKFKIKKPSPKREFPLVVSLRKFYYYSAAAVILLFLAGSLAYYLFMDTGNQDNNLATNEYIIPYGSRSQLILPDGSKIWLNSGSKLSYNNRFGHSNREINLEGEAYFDVARNASLPFVVNTSELNIRVLGTAFNVKAYPDEDFIETTVEHGIVKISGDKESVVEQQTIILKASQKLLYSIDKKPTENKADSHIRTIKTGISKDIHPKPAIDVEKVYTKLYTSWKDNRWIIESEELQSLIIKLERRYNVSFKINDESLKRYRFSGILENETLEQLLEAIKLTAPIVYKIEHKQVILSRNIYFKPN